jgi:ribosomal-protein-serine acetyltransferase
LGPEVCLVELTAADAGRIFLVVEANRAHLREWLPWVDGTRSSQDTRRFLQSVEAGRREGRTLAYGIEERGEFIGVAGSHDIETADRRANIGYWLAAKATGRGLMTRAAGALAGILFEHLGMERLEIRCCAGNTASARVAERLGFQFEGTLRHAQFLHGRFHDQRLYSLLSGEWKGLAEDVERGL